MVLNAQARADMNGDESSKRNKNRMEPFHVAPSHYAFFLLCKVQMLQ